MAKKNIPEKIRRFSINNKDLPKTRNPFHRILSAKAGVSGRLASEASNYQRHQAKTEAQQDIQHQLSDQLSDAEKEVALKNILAEIEQWVGEDGLELGGKNKKAEPQEKGRWYLAALKDELTDDYYQQDTQMAKQQKAMILTWIQSLEKLLSIN